MCCIRALLSYCEKRDFINFALLKLINECGYDDVEIESHPGHCMLPDGHIINCYDISIGIESQRKLDDCDITNNIRNMCNLLNITCNFHDRQIKLNSKHNKNQNINLRFFGV
jgi:hypothetical protein